MHKNGVQSLALESYCNVRPTSLLKLQQVRTLFIEICGKECGCLRRYIQQQMCEVHVRVKNENKTEIV